VGEGPLVLVGRAGIGVRCFPFPNSEKFHIEPSAAYRPKRRRASCSVTGGTKDST
jgi:hypothetical protein